ncbi:MAG TPA: hypothetical protein VFZ25_14960 [Chloroflexota bacterium]|nr:hypothetical protein [Chloroflexota bacterium]
MPSGRPSAGWKRGCTPLAASVLLGVAVGYLAVSATCIGFSPRCLLILVVGYSVGAIIGHLAVTAAGRVFGQWWSEI